MKVTEYSDWHNRVFYCEFKLGGWDNVDPVYRVVETDDEVIVYGGCMIAGNDDYRYCKSDLNFWKVESVNQ